MKEQNRNDPARKEYEERLEWMNANQKKMKKYNCHIAKSYKEFLSMYKDLLSGGNLPAHVYVANMQYTFHFNKKRYAYEFGFLFDVIENIRGDVKKLLSKKPSKEYPEELIIEV